MSGAALRGWKRLPGRFPIGLWLMTRVSSSGRTDSSAPIGSGCNGRAATQGGGREKAALSRGWVGVGSWAEGAWNGKGSAQEGWERTNQREGRGQTQGRRDGRKALEVGKGLTLEGKGRREEGTVRGREREML